jgi:hypothetical protein
MVQFMEGRWEEGRAVVLLVVVVVVAGVPSTAAAAVAAADLGVVAPATLLDPQPQDQQRQQ